MPTLEEFKVVCTCGEDWWTVIISIIGIFISVCGVIVSVLIHRASVNRDKKLSTLNIVREIRKTYPEIKCLSKEDMRAYLSKMEFLCTGINEHIYDFQIVKLTSGRLFLSQYNHAKDHIYNARKTATDPETLYCEYEAVISKLKKSYK